MTSSSENRFQIAILGVTREQIQSLPEVHAMEWLYCEAFGEHAFNFYKGDVLVSSVDLSEVRFDLAQLLGILVIGEEQAFRTMRSEWVAALPAIDTTFTHLTDWDVQAVTGASLECVAGRLGAGMREGGHAALELAVYRREFDRLQRKFSRLEEFIGRKSLQGVTESFEYPPDVVILAESNGKGRFNDSIGPVGASLTQSLPVDSLGFSGFAVFISAKPERNQDLLCVRLRAIETQTVFAEWSLSGDRVSMGWNVLALNHAIDELALSLELLIDWPAERSGWGLALGPPHPYAAFCARVGGAVPLDAPLALRLFANLPGVRVAPDTSALRPDRAPYLLAALVPRSAYAAVSQIVPPLQEGSPGPVAPGLVAYDREIDCVTVHPRPGGLSVARINVVVPRHAWGISARIHLANEHASATEFAMMICAPRVESRELAKLGQLKAPSPSFSGWRTLSPLETGSVSVVLAASPQDRLSLFLATRQSPELSPDFAWARFSRFEFHILPESLLADNEKDQIIPATGSLHPSSEEFALQTASS